MQDLYLYGEVRSVCTKTQATGIYCFSSDFNDSIFSTFSLYFLLCSTFLLCILQPAVQHACDVLGPIDLVCDGILIKGNLSM